MLSCFSASEAWIQRVACVLAAVAVLGPAVSSATSGLTDGLIGIWNFDEGTGSVAHDSSGWGANAAVYGANWVGGTSNSALAFDGVDDYVAIPPLTPITGVPITQISISGWVWLGSSSDVQQIVDCHSASGEMHLETVQDTSSLTFWMDDDACAPHHVGTGELPLNRWQHVVGTYDGSRQCVYVDGVLRDSVQWSGALTVTTGFTLGVGYDCFDQPFRGKLDELRIYDRGLDAAEVEQLYDAQMPHGACCDLHEAEYPGEPGYCVDEVGLSSCVPPNVLYIQQLCADLDPPCGNPGACCDDSATVCVDAELELNCYYRFAAGVLCADLGAATGYTCGDASYIVADWSFNDGTATDWTDHGYDGTIHSATVAHGLSGQGLHFDGLNDYIQVDSPVVSAPPYSICVWVNPVELYDQLRFVISNGAQDGNGFYLALLQDGQWEFAAYRPDGWGGAARLPAETTSWHFLCATWDGGIEPDSLNLYADAVCASGDMEQWGWGAAENLRIGCPSGELNYFFFGDIDEVRIYDRALRSEEVQQLYSSQIPYGACCDRDTAPAPGAPGYCYDDCGLTNCRPPLVFHGEELCADLDPPCGNPGACCNDSTFTCVDGELELNCRFRFKSGVLCADLEQATGYACGAWTPCQHRVDLYSSVDDWHGSTLDVYVNGDLALGGLTLSSYSQMSFYFLADTGDEIHTVFNAVGSSDWAAYYQIFDGSNNLIIQDGGSYEPPSGVTVFGHCPGPGACCEDGAALCTDNVEQADCDGSRWTEAVLCADLLPPCGDWAPCDHRIELYDLYGYGWNGNTLDLYVNGMRVLSGVTLPQGYGPLTIYFPAGTGDSIHTLYHASGSWAYGVYYKLFDGRGTLIVQDGSYQEPSGVTVTARCPGPGACCDDAGPTCLDDVAQTDCTGSRWAEATACADFVPVCGQWTPCEHRVDLYDTYGGGWNGCTLDVYVNGVAALLRITLPAGASPLSLYFPAATGDPIHTVFHATGPRPYEASYKIFDGGGMFMVQDGGYGAAPAGVAVAGCCHAPGACCDDSTYVCTDAVPRLACGSRWAEAKACAALVPACGDWAACEHRVDLYDMYGDGWTGNMLDVYVNGTLVLAGITLPSGAGPLSVTFPAGTGDSIRTVFHATGSAAYEALYQILDGGGLLIIQDGGDYQTPSGVTVTGHCPVPGACCYDATATCTDDLLRLDCAVGSRWAEASACADLYPPCGQSNPCTHRIDLYDLYGDGWNGNTLDLYVNRALVLAGITLRSGAGPLRYQFAARTGDEIHTVYHAIGSYPYEPYYEIYDGTGTLIVLDGIYSQPTGVTVTGSCQPLVGACCFEATGQCNDLVAHADCASAGGAFHLGRQCGELEPACGNPGACCDRATAICEDGQPELSCLYRFAAGVACVELEPPCASLRGDLNCDGALNVFDIDPFVTALVDPTSYAVAYPDCDYMLADVNCDGQVNIFDIDPFVSCVADGGCPPCAP